jgi:hypothetical protein
MSNSRTFPGVTPEILSRMKELGRAEHNIVYDPPDGRSAPPPAKRRSASA